MLLLPFRRVLHLFDPFLGFKAAHLSAFIRCRTGEGAGRDERGVGGGRLCEPPHPREPQVSLSLAREHQDLPKLPSLPVAFPEPSSQKRKDSCRIPIKTNALRGTGRRRKGFLFHQPCDCAPDMVLAEPGSVPQLKSV